MEERGGKCCEIIKYARFAPAPELESFGLSYAKYFSSIRANLKTIDNTRHRTSFYLRIPIAPTVQLLPVVSELLLPVQTVTTFPTLGSAYLPL